MPIDKTLFRQVLSNFPAGVTVITLVGPEEKPYGLTATAFSSVSLLPPLVLVCVDKKAESHPHFAPSGVFVVNLLAHDQQDLSQRFATRTVDKFAGVAWEKGKLGAPVLAGTIGHMECRVAHHYDGGDHTIVVGEIESAAANDGHPLLYFRGGYRNLADLA